MDGRYGGTLEGEPLC